MDVENRDAIFQFDDDSYIVAYWYLDAPSKNVMAIVYRDGDIFRIRYRFRYYRDDKAHDSDDEKSAYSGYAPKGTSEADVIAQTGKSMKLACVAHELVFPGETMEMTERIVRGAFKKFLKLFQREPWAHVKVVKLENN